MAEVCFRDGGRVRVDEIPHSGDRGPMVCTACRNSVGGGEGFFIEVDDMARSRWGVGCMVICGPCMAVAVRPRNIINNNNLL